MRSVRRESTLLLQLHRSQAPLHLRSFQWFLQGMKWIVEKTPTFVSYFLYFIILCNVINYSLYLSFLCVCVGANRKFIWIFFYIIFIDKKFTPEWNAFFNEESSRTWKCPYCAKNQKVMLRTFHSNNNNLWRTL